MIKRVWAGLAAVGAVAFLCAPVQAAETGNAWLHVRVEEGQQASKVSVNLPLSVVEVALKAAPGIIEEHGKVNFGKHHGMKLADVRKLWAQLEAVGDAEFVTVESEGENVRVQRKGDLLQVFVDKKDAGKSKEAKPAEKAPGKPSHAGEEVRVEVPVSLVAALLSGEGDEVNLEAAIGELKKRRGDIVRVRERDNNVRIWIDEQNTQTAAVR